MLWKTVPNHPVGHPSLLASKGSAGDNWLLAIDGGGGMPEQLEPVLANHFKVMIAWLGKPCWCSFPIIANHHQKIVPHGFVQLILHVIMGEVCQPIGLIGDMGNIQVIWPTLMRRVFVGSIARCLGQCSSGQIERSMHPQFTALHCCKKCHSEISGVICDSVVNCFPPCVSRPCCDCYNSTSNVVVCGFMASC